MRPTYLILTLLLASSCASIFSRDTFANEPVTLLGTIFKWRYPDAKIGESQGSDGATISADGNRTVPSTVLKTTMKTDASVDEVLAFYRGLLTRDADNDKKLGIGPLVGRSVIISDDSQGRPFAFHTIVVNSANTSTTLIVTRGKDEKQTHITWKQYQKLEISE